MKKLWCAVVVVLSMIIASVAMSASGSEEMRIAFPQTVVGIRQHGNLLVVVHYREDERNRRLELAWDPSPDGDGEGECGSSTVDITVENDGIPLAKDLILSAGQYDFVATLYRSDGSKVIAKETRFVTR